ncbi:MAG: vWA domain-containing protein [Ardenticatenaceae bacterium]
MSIREQDMRLKLLNSLLTTPHGDLDVTYLVHDEIVEQDPRFYVQLAAWYTDEGEVRDHKEMFVINLVLSKFPGHRDVGLALLRQMPPYQVGRVFDFIKGRTARGKVKAKRKRDGTPQEGAIQKLGLTRNIPRSMKTEITRYLREREANPAWFDSSALQARNIMKRLYASLRIKPSERAQAILFDEKPPTDSRLYMLKQIAKAESPAEQARAIVEHRIPYRVAASLIKQMTPMVLVALINNMSSQELINNIGSLKRHGAFDNPDLNALIEQKLEKAKSAKRVSAYKAKQAIKAANVSQEVAKKLDAVTEAQVKAKGTIKVPTALLIDASGSMSQAIEIGKRMGAMLAGVTEDEAALYVYAFDTMGYTIEAAGPSLAEWEEVMRGIRAGGATSCGVAIEMMRRKGQMVEQIIMITDEGENTAPYFAETLQRYNRELGANPHVVFVKTRGASDLLERRCRQAKIAFDAYQFTGDYYALPNLIPLLSRTSKLDLLMDIMAYRLPKRKAA